MKKFVKFISEKDVEISLNHINELITNIKNEEYKNIIRLYVYKLFYFFIQDKEKFLLFNYENKRIKFLQDFKLKEYPDQINYYYFAPISSLKNDYSKVLKLFNEYPKESYLDKNKTNEFIKNIKDFPSEIFINISINKVISKIGLNNDYKNQAYSNLLKFIYEVLKYQTFDKKIAKLIAFYFDEFNFFIWLEILFIFFKKRKHKEKYL